MLRLFTRNTFILATLSLPLLLLFSACHNDSLPVAIAPPQLLYFMSFNCPGCRQANPLLEQLHHTSAGRYSVSALAFGTPQAQITTEQGKAGLTFPVQAGAKVRAQHYGVQVTPTVLLLSGGKVRERYQGVNGVVRIKRLVEDGVLGDETGILELVRQPGPFGGKAITVRGQLLNKSKDSFIAGWVLSNGVESIHVEQMTLSQAAPPPTAEREPLSGELIGKELRMQGRLRMAGSVPILTVHQWEALP